VGLPVSRSAVSQHLKILKDAGLVEDVAAGTRRIYRLYPVALAALRDQLDTTAAEAAAGFGAGVVHAHARTQWTGRTLRVEVEGWVDPDLAVRAADALGRQVADAVAGRVPEAGSLTWTSRAAPS
jgi:hypothetical protein